MRALTLLVALATASTAHAFSIGTTATHPCHEQITLRAFDMAMAEAVPASSPLNSGDAWDAVRSSLAQSLPVNRYSPRLTDFAVVLVTGVRSPDVDGAAALDLGTLRARHLDPHLQHPHALRSPGQDGAAGDEAALKSAKAWIRERVGLAYAALQKPRDEQYVDIQVWLDFRGIVTLRAWAPAYHLGEALHTTQDSFAHALRSDDFRRVRRVLNYVEATAGEYDQAQDGLPHSVTMDSCTFDTQPVVMAAQEASYQLLRAWQRGPAAVDVWLERWFGWDEACSGGACQSLWTDVVDYDATHSKGPEGCASASGGGLLALFVLLLPRRRWWSVLLVLSACTVELPSFPLYDDRHGCGFQPEPLCDGEPVGHWYASGACEGRVSTLALEGCRDAWVEERLVSIGALELRADGSVANALEVRRRRRVGFGKSCLPDGVGCEERLSPLGDQPCADVGDACVCPVPDESVLSPGGGGAWSEVGDTLRLELDSGQTFEWAACTTHRRLRLEAAGGDRYDALFFMSR